MTRSELRDCLSIVTCGVAIALLLRPFPDTPFIDDWVYARSVEALVVRGRLEILDWSAHPNVAQILWGALFCLPWGFSFTALRISTWVLALLCLCGLYLTLRGCGVARVESLLGTATLGLNPIFFMLATSFMTDVPFLAASVWSTYALIRAVQLESNRSLVLATGLTCLAAGVRVVAIVSPIAAAITLALHAGRWGRHAGRITVALAPLLLIAFLQWWNNRTMIRIVDLTDIAGSPAFRRQYLSFEPGFLARMSLGALVTVPGVLGVALLPLSLAVVRRTALLQVGRSLLVLGLIAAVATWAGLAPERPLRFGSTWAIGELGATEPLVAGAQPIAIAGPLVWALGALAWGSFAVFMAVSLTRRRRGAEAILAWLFLGHLGLMVVLWLFYDRYVLPLIPIAIVLLLAARPAFRRGCAIAVLVLFGTVSLIGVADHMRYNRALWQALDVLRAMGVSASEIDGGYVVNGVLHYTHPDKAPRDAHGERFFPWITHAGGLLRYQLSNQPMGGWAVLHEVPYRRWLGRSGAIYVLRREDQVSRALRTLASPSARRPASSFLPWKPSHCCSRSSPW